MRRRSWRRPFSPAVRQVACQAANAELISTWRNGGFVGAASTANRGAPMPAQPRNEPGQSRAPRGTSRQPIVRKPILIALVAADGGYRANRCAMKLPPSAIQGCAWRDRQMNFVLNENWPRSLEHHLRAGLIAAAVVGPSIAEGRCELCLRDGTVGLLYPRASATAGRHARSRRSTTVTTPSIAITKPARMNMPANTPATSNTPSACWIR
jgi:hypothetical protein